MYGYRLLIDDIYIMLFLSLKRLNKVRSSKESECAAILGPPVVVFSGHSAKIVDVVFCGEEAKRVSLDQNIY